MASFPAVSENQVGDSYSGSFLRIYASTASLSNKIAEPFFQKTWVVSSCAPYIRLFLNKTQTFSRSALFEGCTDDTRTSCKFSPPLCVYDSVIWVGSSVSRIVSIGARLHKGQWEHTKPHSRNFWYRTWGFPRGRRVEA